MIVGIKNSIVVMLLDDIFSIDKLKIMLPTDITPVNAPSYVSVGWGYNDTTNTWLPKEKSGCVFDLINKRYYPHSQYRQILHERTSNDTLQALRKIREGDKSLNWEAWLNDLDAYNLAIENTKTQKTYPDKVIYPKYPEKPVQ